jgi:hypothetical protein
MKLTAHFHLVLQLKIVEYTPIPLLRLHGMVLNYAHGQLCFCGDVQYIQQEAMHLIHSFLFF